jgi:hypothetical protein
MYWQDGKSNATLFSNIPLQYPNKGDATMFTTLTSATRRHFTSRPAVFFAMGLALMASTVSAQTPAKRSKKAAAAVAAPAAEAAKLEPVNSEVAPQGEAIKFNTEGPPANTDHRPMMSFKDPGDTPLGQKAPDFTDPTPEDAGYKAYIGYPKNQVGVYAMPMNLSSTWSFNGQDFNFTNSPVGLGAMYRLIATPMWNLELDYSHFSMSVDQAVISPYRILSSSTSFDQYYAKGQYCFIGTSSFYNQFCTGLEIGNDAYPILNFTSGSDLTLSKVQDIILGVNLAYQTAVGEHFLFKTSIGYNYGTGLGNTGALTSKNNSSYFGKAGVEYNLTSHQIILADLNYMARSAKISGKRGNNDDTWNTKSALLGFKIGYLYSFF